MRYLWFHCFRPHLTAFLGMLALTRLCPVTAGESAVVAGLPRITLVPAYTYELRTPELLALTLPAPLPRGSFAGLLWAGSWGLSGIKADEDGGLTAGSGYLVNRGDFKITALGATARFQTLDKRPALFWEQVDAGITAFSGGLYHNSTGSRLLYGIIDEWGLSARLKNSWGKSVPFAETRRPMTADLKTEPSAAGENEAYLYLGSPRLGKFRAFASIQADKPGTPAIGGGMDIQFAKKTNFRAEGFYTERRLAPSSPSSWFAFPPPLPERDYRFAGFGLFFTAPLFGAAADGAYSETFAWGRDLYGNLALRLGNKPWQLSLGMDAAGSRFVDRSGNAVGAGFRTAVRIDRKGEKAGLFRTGFTLRGPEIGEPFDRGSGTVSYRFPSSFKFPLPLGVSFRPGTVSLTAARDGRDREKILDSIDTAVSLYLGPVRAAFNTSLDCVTDTDFYDFNSFKISGELSYYTGPFQFRAKAGYTERHFKSPVWDTLWYMSIRGKPGRFSVKVSSPDFPEKWECAFSWRSELQIGKR
jgi:hypothetical protein